MRLTPGFSCTPSPPRRDVADDGLPALVHREVLDRHLLLATSPVSLEGLDLSHEGSGERVECAPRAVLLGDIFHAAEATSEGHCRYVNNRHLRRQHGLKLVLGLDALDHGEHEIDRRFVRLAIPRTCRGELPKEPFIRLFDGASASVSEYMNVLKPPAASIQLSSPGITVFGSENRGNPSTLIAAVSSRSGVISQGSSVSFRNMNPAWPSSGSPISSFSVA